MYQKYPVGSTEPLFLASELFHDVLVVNGIGKELANVFARTFYSLKESRKD